MNEFVLSEQNHAFVRSQKWEAAVLPFGATEPHNYHMPYGTDVYEVTEIGRRICGHAWQRGAKVLLLPTIPFGVNTNMLEIPGAFPLNVTPTTLLKVLTDLVQALERRGIRKLMLLNGHGGNELKPLIRELHHTSEVFLCVSDWFRVAQDVYGEIFDSPGEHADEVETSLGLAYFPNLLKMEQAGPGAARPARFEAVRRGWVQISRPFDRMTEDTGLGDPSAASAEKGRRLVEILAQRLGDFLYELAKSPMDARFPFESEGSSVASG